MLSWPLSWVDWSISQTFWEVFIISKGHGGMEIWIMGSVKGRAEEATLDHVTWTCKSIV